MPARIKSIVGGAEGYFRKGHPATSQGRQADPGFTLIEVSIGLVIVAMAVAIAIPAYRSKVLRDSRADAKQALLAVQAAQEKYYVAHSIYASRITEPSPAGLDLPDKTANGHYRITLKIGAAEQSYMATATPVNRVDRKIDTQCGAFSLTDTGVRNVTGSGGAVLCWK